MYMRVIDGVEVTYTENVFSDEEIKSYIDRGRKKHGNIDSMRLEMRGDNDMMVNITYHVRPKHFERIRRITGYLVGTLDRFNDAKKAEENQRVKHGVGGN